jgi:hypothetical protein
VRRGHVRYEYINRNGKNRDVWTLIKPAVDTSVHVNMEGVRAEAIHELLADLSVFKPVLVGSMDNNPSNKIKNNEKARLLDIAIAAIKEAK